MKVLSWFYGTFLGGKYLEFLLWLDQRNKPATVLNPKDVAQIVRQSNKTIEGTIAIKRSINSIVSSKNTENYRKVLSSNTELTKLAARDPNSVEGKYAAIAQQMYVRKDTDVATATDHAKMLDKRINDMYELQHHRKKRELSRQIRALEKEGKTEEARTLLQEWKKNYGYTKT